MAMAWGLGVVGGRDVTGVAVATHLHAAPTACTTCTTHQAFLCALLTTAQGRPRPA
jgi:hypothetical protein